METISFSGTGDDLLIGGVGSDEIFGGAGFDDLFGEDDSDVLKGGADDDLLDGGLGNDRLEGGSGDDIYYADAGDTLVEALNAGTDTVLIATTHTLGANLEKLILTGTSAYTGTGNALANSLNGEVNTGANNLRGLAGNDVFTVGVGDKVYESAGTAFGIDTVASSTLSLNLGNTRYLNVENIALLGSSSLSGTGNAGANRITGNSGANTLNGLAGNDTMTGGVGADTFVFNSSLSASTNLDSITDFNRVDDTIQLENAIFTRLSSTGTLSSSFFRVGSAAADSNDFIIYNPTTGALIYDNNGNGSGGATQFATLTTHPSGLTAADFFVI